MSHSKITAETSDAAGAGVAAGGGWIRGEGCGAKAPPTSFNGYQSSSQSECVMQDGLFVHPEDKVRGLNSLLLNNDSHNLSLMNNITAGGVSASSYGSAGSVNGSVNDSGNKLDSVLAHWDYGNPGRIVKKRPPINKNSGSSRSSGRDRYSKNNLHGHKFVNSKIPYHKKADAVDELAWSFSQTEMMTDRTNGLSLSDAEAIGSSSTLHPHPHFLHPLEERANEKGGPASIHTLCMPSPASVNPVTPLSVSNALTPKQCGPGSVPPSSIASQSARTPGDTASLRSPYPHNLSNGPLTPAMDNDNKLGPTTPKSIGGPPSCGPIVPPLGSPFGHRGKNVSTVPVGSLSAGAISSIDKKPDITNIKNEQSGSFQPHCQQTIYASTNGSSIFNNTHNSNYHPSGPSQVTNSYNSFFKQEQEYSTNQERKLVQINPQSSYKRPALPFKEYEDELQRTQVTLSDSIYNSSSMQDWLNHPVRKYRKTEKCNQKSGGTVEAPKKPLYRRKSQTDLLNLSFAVNGHVTSTLLNGLKLDPDGNQTTGNGDISVTIKPEKESMSMDYKVASTAIKTDDPMDFDSKNKISDDDLYTEAGIKPSMNDLDNLFESDDSDGNVPPSSETPPSSVPNAGTGNINQEDSIMPDNVGSNFTKIKTLQTLNQNTVPSTRIDPTGNLPHDQLSKMFPTPPSHEHNPIASPADGEMGVDPISVHSTAGNNILIKHEQPNSPINDHMIMDISFGSSMEDAALMLSSTKFAAIDLPLMELKSTKLNPFELKYRASNQPFNGINNAITEGLSSDHHVHHAAHLQTPNFGAGSVAHNTSTTAIKTGMSPISPMPPSPRVSGPRSQQHATSNHLSLEASNTPQGTCKVMSGPSSAQSTKYSSNKADLAGTSPYGLEIMKGPEANSLAINLVLSDSLLNVFRDHNFDSCTMCVCSNDGNIRGRDAAKYLPPVTDNTTHSDAHDCPNCQCGFSAVINRKLSYYSGLFYEDETEITSINEDPYQRKKHSLLMVNGDSEENATLTEEGDTSDFTTKSAEVDAIPNSLLELIHKQYSLHNLSLAQNALLKCSDQYLRQLASQHPPTLSMVELMDSNYIISSALEPFNKIIENDNQKSVKLNISSKQECVHKWTLLHAPGPYCSEDIMRVMKSLQPILNASLHVRKVYEKIKVGSQSKSGHSKSQPDISSTLSVQGPLTWRQFHRMAGPLTKGNTDDSPSPLPIPAITVGHEKDFITVSPLALHFWESLSLEPFSQPRDVAYIVVAPENDFLNVKVKTFFKNLSSTYEVNNFNKY